MKELCFNLWYWLDEHQRIHAIAAKAYVLDGTEAQKGASLADLSGREYEAVPALALEKPIHYSELKTRGIEAVYEAEFDRIQAELPDNIPFPEDKLFYATPLYDFGNGYVPALIGNGMISERG